MRPIRAVLVDDHAGFRQTLRRMLEADGWAVVGEAGDGEAAIAVIERARPDVVLLDVGLPDLDGFAVAALIGARHKASSVILISSREASSYRDRLATAGDPVRGFVAKHDLDGSLLRRLLEEPS